jgi:hypothetical protein
VGREPESSVLKKDAGRGVLAILADRKVSLILTAHPLD